MAPDKLENGTQCCFNKFDCRLFISRFSQFAFYFFLSHSVISKSLAQPFCKCAASQLALCWKCDSPRTRCAWWTTLVWREQTEIKLARRGIFIVAWCHSVKVCALAALPFQSQTKWCFDQHVKIVPGTTFIKRTCNMCGLLKKWGTLLQPLG